MTELSTDAAAIAVEKQSLRKSLRVTRAALSRELVRARSEAAAARLLALSLPPGQTVALYAGMENEGELDPRLADPLLRARGLRPVYPRIAERTPPRLSFHTVDDVSELVRGPYGFAQPAEDAPLVALASIDIFVVPGVGFSPSGARLGFGGGYYDAALGGAPTALRIGYAHPDQCLSQLPMTHTDARLDLLVGPDATIVCAPRPGAPALPGDHP